LWTAGSRHLVDAELEVVGQRVDLW
jgi:hypothetical protein